MSIRQRIIEESTAMFSTYGLKSVRMDDIANALGISKRTLYETFGDKENLIAACVKHFFNAKARYDCQRSAGAKNIIEELLINLNNKEDMIKKSFTLMNDLRKFYPKIHKEISEESFEAGTREMKEKLHRGIEQGIIVPQIDVDSAVSLFVDIMQTIFMRLNAAPPSQGESIARTLQYCVVFFSRGIATIEGVRMIDEYLAAKLELK